MKRIDVAKLLILLFCGGLVFSLAGCGSVGAYVKEEPKPESGPPAHAPARGYRAKHTYHYYPDVQVYFDISRKVYFYRKGDFWLVSASLPSGLAMELGDYVLIEMDTRRPNSRFEEHRQKYPPGMLKKE